MSAWQSVQRLFRRIHEDRRGAVSLETILIIGAIAIPIMIFILKFGWPRIRDYFYQSLDNLEDAGDDVSGGSGGSGGGTVVP